MITYQAEKFADCIAEIVPYLSAHRTEIDDPAPDPVPFDPDYERYLSMDASGALSVVTARCDGRLIGYSICAIATHSHSKHTLHAFTDLFFVDPEYRKGFVGVKLLRAAEQELAHRGVVKHYTGAKIHKDLRRLFEYLGYHPNEVVYSKIIG